MFLLPFPLLEHKVISEVSMSVVFSSRIHGSCSNTSAELQSEWKRESVIHEKGSCPACCWGQVSQMILAIQGICKGNGWEIEYISEGNSHRVHVPARTSLYCSVNINHSLRVLGNASRQKCWHLRIFVQGFSSEALPYETDPDKEKSFKVQNDLAVKPALTFVIHSVLCCKV